MVKIVWLGRKVAFLLICDHDVIQPVAEEQDSVQPERSAPAERLAASRAEAEEGSALTTRLSSPQTTLSCSSPKIFALEISMCDLCSPVFDFCGLSGTR